MPQSTLVTGATGKLGRIIVRQLLAVGIPVRALTRRPEIAASLFGRRIEIAVGDFNDRDSLDRAFTSVDRLLLLSPISETLARDQIGVIDAAERRNVRRVVKISGSDWTIDPPGRSISGMKHAEVERRLDASPIEAVSLRPNAWMQVSLPRYVAQIKADQRLLAAFGDAAVSFIDARDIADVAVHQLLADRLEGGPLVLTGSSALSVHDIAGIAARELHRPVVVASEATPNASGPQSFEQRAIAEFLTLIGHGGAAATTNAVARLLGRAPRTVEAFLAEHLAAVAA
jgi:uncharacterized protein YbjT (DUF2867 family)